jgi:hypothetical protein
MAFGPLSFARCGAEMCGSEMWIRDVDLRIGIGTMVSENVASTMWIGRRESVDVDRRGMMRISGNCAGGLFAADE